MGFGSDEHRANERPETFKLSALHDENWLYVKGRHTLFRSDHAVIVVVRGSKELDEMKDALAEAKRKVVLIASASHELRTPLNGILNSLEIMKGLAQGELAEYLEVGVLSSHYLMNAVNDVLVTICITSQDYAQMGEGRLKLNYDTFDAKAVVKESVDMMSLEARKKGVELVTVFERGLSTYYCYSFINRNIYSDSNRFRQIVLNLLANAVKFTMKGSITVRLKPGVGVVKCYVIDTGVGIEPSLCARLFAPFARGADAKGLNKSGSGLGLSISKSLCERLGGHIRVKSTLGLGSNFAFTIATNLDVSPSPGSAPLQQSKVDLMPMSKMNLRSNNGTPPTLANPGPSMMKVSFEDKSSADLQKEAADARECSCPQILCVDDAYFNRFTLRTMLKKLGQSCDEVYININI